MDNDSFRKFDKKTTVLYYVNRKVEGEIMMYSEFKYCVMAEGEDISSLLYDFIEEVYATSPFVDLRTFNEKVYGSCNTMEEVVSKTISYQLKELERVLGHLYSKRCIKLMGMLLTAEVNEKAAKWPISKK